MVTGKKPLGGLPRAVVRRSVLAREYGWDDKISVRVRNGKTSVLHRMIRTREVHRMDPEILVTIYYDGKAYKVYYLNGDIYVHNMSFRTCDGFLRR